MFFPTLAACALTFQATGFHSRFIGHEIYGYEYINPAAKDEKVAFVLNLFERCLSTQYIAFLALGTFGWPKLDQDTDCAPWMFLIPIMLTHKYVS